MPSNRDVSKYPLPVTRQHGKPCNPPHHVPGIPVAKLSPSVGTCPYCHARGHSKAEFIACRIAHTE